MVFSKSIYPLQGYKRLKLAEAVCLRVAKDRLQKSRISTKRRIKFLNLVPGLFLDQQNEEQQPELPPEQVTAKTGSGISQRKGKKSSEKSKNNDGEKKTKTKAKTYAKLKTS